MAATLDADYVVYGAGAMGMAFIDTLMTESKATVILVDKHGQPGGHWNDAYGYVRLHQPSAYYGVNSRDLQRDHRDYLALASRNEVLAYYESVISKFVASGRVQYFPMCQCSDPSNSRSFYSLVQAGKTYQVAGRAKIVNGTYLQCMVPSISRADTRYGIAEGVKVVPLNELPQMGQAWPAYCVVGSGKTGMDCVLWLLENGVDSSRITWISPNDSWCLMRDSITPDGQLKSLKDVLEPFCTASTVEEFYTRLEAGGFFHRIDPKVRPTKNKCATVSASEMARLRTVQMTRLGRVKRIEQDRVCLEKGDFPSGKDTLYVDCSTDGLAARPPVPVFKGETITLQSIALCQQVFSAALIAHIEIKFGTDEAQKNSLSAPVPHPTFEDDYITHLTIHMKNKVAWGKAGLNGWLNKSRLNIDSHTPSCGACLAFLCSDLCKVKRLFKGMKRLEHDMVDNLTKLAEQVEKRH